MAQLVSARGSLPWGQRFESVLRNKIGQNKRELLETARFWWSLLSRPCRTTEIFDLLAMKVILNKWIPVKGFKCINLFGILFVREDCPNMDRYDLNHEAIHTSQMKELAYIFFYIIYVLEWLVRLFKSGNAYRNISFEQEAYKNQNNLEYLEHRKLFAMWR